MNKLFMIYLGGGAPKANIELHDIQFVIAQNIEDTYSQLKANWFGTLEGLHIDSYKVITGADGYEITLHDKSQQGPHQLYFVNLGGYRKGMFSEIHDFNLFVAKDEAEAKSKATDSLLSEVSHKHKDNLMEVDDCLEINALNGKFIHLQASDETYNLEPDWFGYNVIA